MLTPKKNSPGETNNLLFNNIKKGSANAFIKNFNSYNINDRQKLWNYTHQERVTWVNQHFTCKYDLLTFAILHNQIWAVQFLIENNAPINYKINDYGDAFKIICPLSLAIILQRIEIIKILLTHKDLDIHEVNYQEKVKISAFELAWMNYPDIAQILLQHKCTDDAIFTQLDEQGAVLLDCIINLYWDTQTSKDERFKSYRHIIVTILEKYKQFQKAIPLDTFLQVCCQKDKFLFLLFIKADKTLVIQNDILGKAINANALSIAIELKDDDFTIFMIEKSDQKIVETKKTEIFIRQKKEFYGEKPALIQACEHSSINVVKSIIDKGCDLFDMLEIKPLNRLYSEKEKTMSSLEENNLFIHKNISHSKDIHFISNESCLHAAINANKPDIVSYLLTVFAEKMKEDKEKSERYILSGFFWAMQQKKCVESFSAYFNYLLPIDPDHHVNASDAPKKLISPLCLAISNKYTFEEIQKLIALGAPIHPHLMEGENEIFNYHSPLALAITYNNSKMISYLLEKKADPTTDVYAINSNNEKNITSIVVLFCSHVNQDNTAVFVKLLTFWEHSSVKKLNLTDALMICILKNKPVFFKILWEYRNKLSHDYDVDALISLLFKYPHICKNIPNCFFLDNNLNDMRINGNNLLISCIYLNNPFLYKKILNYTYIYNDANEILDEESPSIFDTACHYFQNSKIYLQVLIKIYFSLKDISLDAVFLEKSPIEVALYTEDISLLTKLINNNMLSDSDKNYINQYMEKSNNIEIKKFLISIQAVSDPELQREVLLSQGFQDPSFTHHNYLNNCFFDDTYQATQLMHYFNLIKELRESHSEEVFPAKHFLLFRFYETLLEINKKNDSSYNILKPKFVVSIRNKLAHNYHNMSSADWKNLLDITLSLEYSLLNWQNNGNLSFSLPQFPKNSLPNLEIENFSTTDKIANILQQLDKISALYFEMQTNKTIIANSPLLLRIQECIWLIGESYQAINNFILKEKAASQTKQLNLWAPNENSNLRLWVFMDAARFVRRCLSHEIEENHPDNAFNIQWYLEWVNQVHTQKNDFITRLSELAQTMQPDIGYKKH